jgi:glycosyltransferase involved in cell wall biosynthesis
MAEITLLIPCYNAAAFLPRLLASVRALTQPFAAILCYDDGSRDDTVAVARGLGLEIITGNPNRGVAHARNRLAAAAHTEWIHFHDADDLLAPGYVAQLAPWCDDRHDIVSCDADWIDEHSRATLIPWRFDAAALARDPLPSLLAQAMGLNNSIIRRTAWEKIGGCDESLAMWEDADVHIRLARSGARFHHVPAVLTFSLRRGESFSHDYRRNWTCRLDALERYAADASAARVRTVLAAEAEKAAGELALLGDKPAALRAVALCRRLGGNPPTSAHPLLRALKPFVPAYPLLRWQARRRQRTAPPA